MSKQKYNIIKSHIINQIIYYEYMNEYDPERSVLPFTELEGFIDGAFFFGNITDKEEGKLQMLLSRLEMYFTKHKHLFLRGKELEEWRTYVKENKGKKIEWTEIS